MIDLRPLETERTRRGYVLRCPQCGSWARALLIVDWELLCRDCVEKVHSHRQVDALSVPIIQDY